MYIVLCTRGHRAAIGLPNWAKVLDRGAIGLARVKLYYTCVRERERAERQIP